MICPSCLKDFNIKGRTKFCSDECYLSDKRQRANEYYYNVKKKLPKPYPEWICQECGFKKKLNFFPRKDFRKMKKVKCPRCG